MRVLLVSPKMENPNGGIAVWTDAYLEGCQQKNINCSLLNIAMVGERAKNGSAKRNFFDEITRTRRIYRDLGVLLKENEYDAVHLNTSCGTFGVIRDYGVAKKIKKKQPNSRIILHFHCDIGVQIRNPISKHFLKKLVKIVDCCIVLCESSKKYLKENFDKDSIIIPNFIKEELIRKEPKQINDTIEKVFFVGRIEIAKGAKEIYELATRFPDIVFELAGAVSETVKEWEKPDNIKLLGSVSHDEVLRRMDEADVFLFPSHSEGFSVALLEAMARGLPAIVTDVGANKDMIGDNCGFIVSVGDVDCIEDFVTLFDKNKRNFASSCCVEKVRTEYEVKVVIAKYIDCYNRKKGSP